MFFPLHHIVHAQVTTGGIIDSDEEEKREDEKKLFVHRKEFRDLPSQRYGTNKQGRVCLLWRHQVTRIVVQ